MLLVLGSAYPLAFQIAEVVASRSAYARYFPVQVAAPTTVDGHQIDVTDRAIVIDGRRIKRLEDTRSIAVVDLRDKRLGGSTPVVVEWRGGRDRATWQYRTVAVQANGQVAFDEFSYSERGSPRIRTVLARFVSPTGIGFFSDATQGWPTVLYPVIYPWLTVLGGVGMLLVSFLAARRHPRSSDVRHTTAP
ncbi:MAG TPA: hypothetical protein VEK11_02885 [Thermoanaerobaculia bacterium]|nr:hypothetical protein [Thermoanaerobaculia bacterium]